MKYPVLNRKPERTVEIPALSGGLNLRDGANAILDNQLSEAKNVWFKHSRLKTRPGMRLDAENVLKTIAQNQDVIEFKVHEDIVDLNGCVLISYAKMNITRYSDGNYKKQVEMELFWSDGTQQGRIFGKTRDLSDQTPFTYFVFKFNDEIYCVTSEGMYRSEINNTETNFLLYGENSLLIDKTGVTSIFYTPTVFTNGLVQQDYSFSATKWESYNQLGCYAKVIYSTVNPDLQVFGDSNQRHLKSYALPGMQDASLIPTQTKDKKIVAVITDENGIKYVHEITLGADGNGTQKNWVADGLYMQGNCTCISFYTDEECQYNAYVDVAEEQIFNNMEIYFPYENKIANDKIFKMTRTEWYGGASEGINGGTRLFLCGNTESKNKNLVVWSDLNNPLYFPDNAYFRVGDDLQPVTAFGKQNDMLIIFKPNEMYGTCYTRGDSIAASQVIENGVSYQSSSVYFPLTLLHSKIGCDIPNSVQLCKNRLVWAHTNGNIYTLVSQNQYSERNVFPIGEMLKPKLKNLTTLATSADVDGMYYLLDNEKMYVIDYSSYGYSYVSGYSKDEDSNLKIPSWYFELPRSGVFFQECGMFRMLCSEKRIVNSKEETRLSIYDFVDGKADLLAAEGDSEIQEKEIEFFFKTKLFDFGHPELTKNINSVNFSVSASPLDLQVKYITENAQSDSECIAIPGIVGKILNIVLKPFAKLNTHFGIEISGSGNFEGDSLKINYKTAGGAK